MVAVVDDGHGVSKAWACFNSGVSRLADADYLAVLSLAHDMAGIDRPGEFAPAALKGLGQLVRSDVSTLNELDPLAGRFAYAAHPLDYPFPAGSDAVWSELAPQHPLIVHTAQTGDGSARKVSDLVSEREWHGSEIYQRFYAWVGVEHQMSFTLPAPAPILVGVALNRVEGDFDERDRAVLNLARPHLAQSWRRAREYERLHLLLTAASGVLAESGSSVVVVRDGVDELTPGALVNLYRFFGRPAPRDALPLRVRGWLDAQRHADLQPSRPLHASLDGRQLILRFLPGLRGSPDVILLDERPDEVATDTVRQVGLTNREAEVLRLLGNGLTNGQIAQHLSLSTWTVKRHLANIYTKLGVSSRVRAVSVALEIDAHHRETRR